MKKKTKQVPVPVKEKNKFKDKFFAYLLAGCMIFWTIASVLGIVGFANTVEKEKAVESSTAVAVSADNIHQVRQNKGASNRQVKDKQKVFNTEGTNLYNFRLDQMNMWTFCTLDTDTPVCRLVTDFHIQRVGNTIYFFWRNHFGEDQLQKSAIFEVGNEVYKGWLSLTSIDEGLTFDMEIDLILPSGSIPSSDDYCPISYSINFEPYSANGYDNAIVISVTEQYIGKGSMPDNFNYSIRIANEYLDIDNARYSSIGVYFSSGSSLVGFDYIEGVSFIDVITSSNYEYGYNAGYDEGRLDGRNDGYQSGYTAGQSVGYNQGYTAGLADNGGEWSFRSLLTAVVDTPVQVFTDLFNFEILGVNLTGFFLGLFSIALCLGVIKLIF